MVMIFLLIILTFSYTILVRGQPRIIDISPGVPVPLSTIVFTVSDFRSSHVENVTLYVQECSNETCYENISYPITGNQYQEYRTNVTLTHKDATYINYRVECVIDGVPEYSPILSLDLQIERKTPGFDLVFFISAITVALFLLRKKRDV
jgi:hypothetical protein